MHPLALAWLIAIAVLLAWVAGSRQTYPARRMTLVATAVAIASLSTLWWPGCTVALTCFNLAGLVIAAVDVWKCPVASQFHVCRRTESIVSLQQSHPVTLEITYRGRRPTSAQLVDDVPGEFSAVPQTHAVTLDANSRATLHYQLRASRRGAFRQESVWLRVTSRWGLWCRVLRIACLSSLQVYPDLRQLKEYLLLARSDRLALMGVRRTRKIGQDHEFERLRDYTPDDQFKHIDWRSTARRRKLTVRDYQSSPSQRIVFLIDCGRMMHQHVGGLSLLDHALNACLMLSYVALRQGDAAGMMLFGDQVRVFVPPAGGKSQMKRLLRGSFDIFPQMVETRYDLAFRHLARVCRRRALVILVTNVIDAVNTTIIQDQLSAAHRRHIPLCVLLRDRDVYRRAEREAPQGEAVYATAAAAHILHWRRVVIRELEQRGALTLDVFPDELTAPLINCYLEIKARHLL